MLSLKQKVISVFVVLPCLQVAIACMAKPVVKPAVSEVHKVSQATTQKPSAAVMTAAYQEKAKLESVLRTLKVENLALTQEFTNTRSGCMQPGYDTDAAILEASADCVRNVEKSDDLKASDKQFSKVVARLEQLTTILDKDPNGCSIAECD